MLPLSNSFVSLPDLTAQNSSHPVELSLVTPRSVTSASACVGSDRPLTRNQEMPMMDVVFGSRPWIGRVCSDNCHLSPTSPSNVFTDYRAWDLRLFVQTGHVNARSRRPDVS